jgi:hypothetical protein
MASRALMFARTSACSKRYKGVPSTYLLASTSASVDGVCQIAASLKTRIMPIAAWRCRL